MRISTNAPRAGGAKVALLMAIALLCMAGALLLLLPSKTSDASLAAHADPHQPESADPTDDSPTAPSAPRDSAPRLSSSGVTPAAPSASAPRAAAPEASAPYGEVTRESRHLVDNLSRLEMDNGLLTVEAAAEWRTNLAHLVELGASGVPAIREFLDKNADYDFGSVGRQMLGYSSVRLAMMDALAQVGGPDAVSTFAGMLQSTADPKEIAKAGAYLEQAEPGKHRAEVLEAARQALVMAREGKIPDRDVAPLFEVFQNYGDASVAQELAKSAKDWNYYSMFSLARMPEDAGIPTLVQIATGEMPVGGGARVPALQMLAEVAATSETARDALIAQAKNNALTAYNWATLESVLAGDQVRFSDSAFDPSGLSLRPGEVKRTHISSGNQNFFSAPPPQGLTAEQIQQYSALIDKLTEVTTDPSGLQALERSKALLQRRSAVVQSTPSPNPGQP